MNKESKLLHAQTLLSVLSSEAQVTGKDTSQDLLHAIRCATYLVEAIGILKETPKP